MSQRYLGGIITANPTAPTMASASGVWTLEQQLQYSQSITPKVIPKSVRLRSSASAYFSRTPTSVTSGRAWTWSAWVKRGALGNSGLFDGYVSTTNFTTLTFSNNSLLFYNYVSSVEKANMVTPAVFRDSSAWYHVVLVYDSANATSADRLIIYVNGVRQTLTTTTAVTQNDVTYINNTSASQRLGVRSDVPYYFDGYVAETYFIDGQALAVTSFGAYDSNGVWQPLGYTGTYGTNGFYLNFTDNSAATATTLGKDYSGNGNNWTPNNISVTAGTTYDSMLDSPTNFNDGGTGVGNYAVLNPLDTVGGTFSNGNLSVSVAAGGGNLAFNSIAVTSGKFYWEITPTSAASPMIGIGDANYAISTRAFNGANGWYYYNSGLKYNNGTGTAYGSSYTNGDVIGIALDMDNGQVTFYKNNVSQGVAFTGLTGKAIIAALNNGGSGAPQPYDANFGQRPFTYTPPTGFKALNTQNLALAVPPTITNGAKYMAASLYTGNGGTAQSIANSANNTIGTTFLPDFVWIKARNSAAYNHRLYDSVRGVGKEIYSSSTAAEATVAQSLTSFNSNGFTIGTDLNNNNSGTTYVGWQWKASGTTSSITAGQYSTGPNVPSITSTVSIGATQGFSVVTYTGTGANATVGHGLGVAPSMIIIKNRSQASAWIVGHQNMATSTPWAGFMVLSTTAAYTTASGSLIWNSTAPTSTVFSVGTDTATNFSGNSLVAYCFAAVAGYSAFGKYTGNGAADGPFVYTGFRPRYLLIKRTDAAASWYVYDTSRATYNTTNAWLQPDTAAAENTATTWEFDLLSNGFKVRNSGAFSNASGGTYIYAAFAENPFTISRAR